MPGSISSIGLSYLHCLTRLQSLNLSIIVSDSDGKQICDDGAKMLANLERLTSLELGTLNKDSESNYLGSEGLYYLCIGLSNIERMNISTCFVQLDGN